MSKVYEVFVFRYETDERPIRTLFSTREKAREYIFSYEFPQVKGKIMRTYDRDVSEPDDERERKVVVRYYESKNAHWQQWDYCSTYLFFIQEREVA